MFDCGGEVVVRWGDGSWRNFGGVGIETQGEPKDQILCLPSRKIQKKTSFRFLAYSSLIAQVS